MVGECPGHPDVTARVLSPLFGSVEVVGIDVERHAGDAQITDWLRSLLAEHAVLCIPQPRKLIDEEFQSVVRFFGPVKDPLAHTADGEPVRYSEARQVIDAGFVLTDELRDELSDVTVGGDDLRPGLFQYFHTDDSYVPTPAAATVLHARALPEGGGGDTVFIDMRAAFGLLDAATRERLVGLHAVHAYNNRDAFPPRPSASGDLECLVEVQHPVVRAHPMTGAAALYFDLDRATHIAELPVDEGRRLMQSLQDHAEAAAPRYGHAWHPHDVLVWDNASVQHRASGDFDVGQPRRFWRSLVEGSEPVAFAPT
jgi:alpha-ketoglutarate-dependent taurine dioxygenase